jgi:hypothetical protein
VSLLAAVVSICTRQVSLLHVEVSLKFLANEVNSLIYCLPCVSAGSQLTFILD